MRVRSNDRQMLKHSRYRSAVLHGSVFFARATQDTSCDLCFSALDHRNYMVKGWEER